MKNIKDIIRQSVGYLIVFITSVIYILTAIFVIDKTDKTIWQILGDGALAFFLGIFINRIFELQGMINGEQDPKVLETNKLHGQKVVKIEPYIDRLDDWCNEQNNKNYKIQRTKILSAAGLSYSKCFDENGIALDYILPDAYFYTREERKDKRKKAEYVKAKFQYKCYRSAVRLKLTPLSSTALTSENVKKEDPGNLGQDKKTYEKRRMAMDIITKLTLSIVFGLYSIKLIQNFSWANLIWTGLQVGFFLCLGIIKMFLAQSFITGEFRSRTIKKIDYLEMFYQDVTKQEGEEQNG